MSADEATATFAERVLESQDQELRRLVAAGLAPLPLPELLAVQVELACDDDEEVAQIAHSSLAEIDPRIVASTVGEGPPDKVVRYFAAESKHPVIVESILRLRQVPRDLLGEMARSLDADGQELLLLRQDAIVEEPSILDALAENGQLSSYARRRIAEYREHLLPRERRPDDEADTVVIGDDEVDEIEAAKIRAEFETVGSGDEKDHIDDLWRASETRIRTLPVGVRMRLARGATPALRRILIRDQNPTVALAIMQFSPISESEVERIALSRVVVDDVLTLIGSSKTWCRRYSVVYSLCQNPRTPVNIGIRLMPRLSARDLLHLSRNRNVPEAVRSRALRLYRIKVR